MQNPPQRFWPVGCLLLIAACATSGCVSRRLTIRSDPPGALVEIEGERIGYTPVSVDFTYYATREFRLSKVGYEPLTVQQPVQPPLYQIPPFDFFSDNFLGRQVTDRHEFLYQLVPQRVVNENELLDRAAAIRSRSQLGQ